ncbi:MAG: porin [Gammaproteobacteria bacterium]|nr:porin [Gammaproteobacteria bacterium]
MKNRLLLLSMILAMNALADNSFYGSLNVGLEYRDVKDNDIFDDHMQMQDAYSYLGVKGEQEIQPGLTGFYNYKIYVDVVKGKLYKNEQLTWAGANNEQNDAHVGLRGGFGQVSVGYQWNAYYNAIAWTTDRFSSGWTGFDTYASFQLSDLIVYQTPSIGGLTAVLNIQSGVDNSTGKSEDRFIASASYNLDALTAHIAYDDLGAGSTELLGVAAEYNMSNMRFAIKHEIAKEGLGSDDASITSVHASLTSGSNTYRVHFGTGNYPSYLPLDDSKGENEGSEVGLGMEHVMNDNMYIFVEYHMSDEYCAYDLTEGNGNGGYDATPGNEIYGCQVISVGTQYSF